MVIALSHSLVFFFSLSLFILIHSRQSVISCALAIVRCVQCSEYCFHYFFFKEKNSNVFIIRMNLRHNHFSPGFTLILYALCCDHSVWWMCWWLTVLIAFSHSNIAICFRMLYAHNTLIHCQLSVSSLPLSLVTMIWYAECWMWNRIQWEYRFVVALYERGNALDIAICLL